MLVSDFHFDLPPERIAQEPLPDRAASRLLHLMRSDHKWEDRKFREFPNLLRPDDLLVLNNTRVFPARLYGRLAGNQALPPGRNNPAVQDSVGGRVEVLLTRQLAQDPNEWECLVRPGRKIGIGQKLHFSRAVDVADEDGPNETSSAAVPAPTSALEGEITARDKFGERHIRFSPVDDFFARLERIGHVPLPPYIQRERGRDDRVQDRDRYQTVYAQDQDRGSVAAPTAGLHFTPEIIQQIRGRGIEIAEITLHVGLGTFQPLRAERVEDNKLHREWYEISPEAAQAINRAKADGRRVIAVGTTTVRTLEHASARTIDNGVQAGCGEADAFIYPGYRFRIVDALLTNFHLPQSTLLMLVCALAGKDSVMAAYRHAVEAGYRFYSYGDCMFVDS
jgi:S-adenosylmethionine:tRNA ribosyltransferase-isomerase